MKKYELVIKHIKEMIDAGEIQQGKRLPSIRTLANSYGYNKSTVIRAFKSLEEEHVIYSIPKGGYYLVGDIKEMVEEERAIDFNINYPDEKILPYREFGHCFNKSINRYQHIVFEEMDEAGLSALRTALAAQLMTQQVYTKKENLFITTGTQQAISILLQMPFPSGRDAILVEEPGYGVVIETARLYKCPILTIKRDYDGIDLLELERIFKREKIKFFFTMPRFQNPLGTSYSEKVKKKIVELAIKYDVYIVEDDCIIDLDVSKRCMSLHYYDTADKVLYLKSFSKSFIPGIRLGLVLLPKELQETFLAYKRCSDIGTSVLNQGALEIFIQSGLYEKHCSRIQHAYCKKMDMIKEYLKSHPMTGVEMVIPRSGIYLWLTVNKKIPMDVLFTQLKSKGILVKHGLQYYVNPDHYSNGIRLCILNIDDHAIKKGLSVILNEINELYFDYLK